MEEAHKNNEIEFNQVGQMPIFRKMCINYAHFCVHFCCFGFSNRKTDIMISLRQVQNKISGDY